MRVELRRHKDSTDNGGGFETLGQIELKDGKLIANTGLAQRVLERPVFDAQAHEVVAANEPERYLKLLSREYESPYLWATKPLE